MEIARWLEIMIICHVWLRYHGTLKQQVEIRSHPKAHTYIQAEHTVRTGWESSHINMITHKG